MECRAVEMVDSSHWYSLLHRIFSADETGLY